MYPAFGFFAGAAIFYFSDKLIANFGTNNPMKLGKSKKSNLIMQMVLAIVSDGVPESIIIGLGLYEGTSGNLTMLVAVFIYNLPEAIAGS